MAGFVVIAALVVAVIGVRKNIRQVQMDEICRKSDGKVQSYSFGLTVLSGLGTLVALVGLVMLSGGSLDKAAVVLAGLALSVLTCLPAVKQANEIARVAKKYGKNAGGEGSPVLAWLNITLVGVGKVVHAVMVCTLVGIPLYNMLAQTQQNMDQLVRQIQLRQELEELRKKENLHMNAKIATEEFNQRMSADKRGK